MTNSTIPAEPVAAPSSTASFYRWEVLDKPIAIYLSLDLIDRLEREVLESFKAITKRGSEIGGVMAGRVVSGATKTVTIEHFEPVECDYSRGPLYLLSDEDKGRLKQAIDRASKLGNGLSVTGFFRSNTRRELVLDEDDQAVAAEYFSDPNHVFLLVRPYAMKPSMGTFFFREEGKTLGESRYLEFPFKRAELLKTFAQYIGGAPEKSAEAPPAKEPLVMPRREEKQPAAALTPKLPQPPPPAPATLRREEPKPAMAAPPKREEAPPLSFKREERPAIVPVTPRREEPVLPKREERAAPPLNLKREERPPILPVQPKREERITGPTLVSKREEPPAPPVVKRDEKPAILPAAVKREERPQVTVKREEKPAVTPLISKREEPAPAKPVEKPVVAKPAESIAAAPKKEEATLKSSPDEFARSLAPLLTAAAQPEPGPGLFSRMKWVILAVLVIGLTAGAWFAYQGLKTPVQEAAKQSDSLSLKVDRNAGQYILSWDRKSTLIATATRATLSIMDGDHKEDVDLDLSQLRTGNIVYSPMTNDVSFALEVTDLKHGKSIKESTRVLGARPSPTVAAIPPSAAKPAPDVPDKLAAVQPPIPAPRTQTPPEQPKVVAGPAVTVAPPKPESLAARLRAAEPQEMPAPPTLESSSNALAGSAPVTSVPQVAAPAAPPAPPQAQPAQQPAPAVPAKGGQVHEARLIKRVAPNYPNLARQAHISGIVRVQATVGKDGRVKKTSVLSGPPLLRQAAAEAVQRWLYSPALLNGEPVEVETQVDVSFTM